LIAAGSYFHVLDGYELDTLDWRFRIRPQIPVTDRVIFVEISDDTIAQLGRFPLDRSYHATLIEALSEAGAKAIVFDIFFSEEHPQDDQLEMAINRAGNVYLPYVLAMEPKPKAHMPQARGYAARNLERFATVARGQGHINVMPDPDGKFRKVPLYVHFGKVSKPLHSLPPVGRDREGGNLAHSPSPIPSHQGRGNEKKEYSPYLSLIVGANLLETESADMSLEAGRSLLLGKRLKIPLDENSNVLINFSGKWGKGYRHFSYADVLRSHISRSSGEEPVLDLNVFKDKVCLIGLTAEGTTDVHPSPFEPLFPSLGIHADLLNSMFSGKFIIRAPRLWNLVILFLMALAIGWAAMKTKPLKGFFILSGMTILLVLGGIVVFNFWGVWVDLIYPASVMAAIYLLCTLYNYLTEWKARMVMEEELRIAQKIQLSFLPKSLPLTPEIELAARMLTAKQVGGDLYDCFTFNDGQLGVMIGDVTGKGIPASLFMAMVVGSFKFYAVLENQPQETLLRLNEKLIKEASAGLFVTLFYAIFDFKKGKVIFANGGHLPVLYIPKEGKSQFLDVEDGLPLGMMESKYSEGEKSFSPGDIFVFYTDGITEAKNANDEMYDKERLKVLVEKHRHRPVAELIQTIEDDLRRFEPPQNQHDDITYIVLKVI